MSNRSSSKQHGCAQVNIQRPKSVQSKRNNKAKAKARQDERNKKRFTLYSDAVKKLGSDL